MKTKTFDTKNTSTLKYCVCSRQKISEDNLGNSTIMENSRPEAPKRRRDEDKITKQTLFMKPPTQTNVIYETTDSENCNRRSVLERPLGNLKHICEYKNPSWVSMQDKEILPEGLEFQPGTRLAESLVKIPTQRLRFFYPVWTHDGLLF